MGRELACMDKNRSAYKAFMGKPEGKRPLGKHRHRLEDNRVKSPI
jgi:hypothetical protein